MLNRYNVTDYGAVSDGSLCTEGIQKANGARSLKNVPRLCISRSL